MSEPERPSEETKTEFIPKEAPPQTLEISEAASGAPAPAATAAAAPTAPPAAAPPAAARPSSPSSPLPDAQTPPEALGAPAADSYPAAGSYADAPYPEAPAAPQEAFVPPELMARRRAMEPPSTPYQPIAGFSTVPVPVDQPPPTGAHPTQAPPSGPVLSASPMAGMTSAPPATGAIPAGPANGFATTATGPASGSRPPVPPASGGGPAGRRSGPMLAVLALVVVIALVVGGVLWKSGQKDDNTPVAVATPTATAAPVVVKFSVSSYSPKGSGFTEKGDTWESQTYKRPSFGNLKKGIGLVLDLGSAQEVASVSFNAESGPMQVELHSADEMPAGDDAGDKVGEAVAATGKTELDASKGGKHQYWMIWVTEPGPTMQAVISDLGVSASPSAS